MKQSVVAVAAAAPATDRHADATERFSTPSPMSRARTENAQYLYEISATANISAPKNIMHAPAAFCSAEENAAAKNSAASAADTGITRW